ncbi:MAG: arginine--tRNA ligase [Candidatus Pacebacteria bacterium]|nr:arginine--tRNA ligase [Candidatus Paceibacterota bacterium]MBP9851561.1 arginine--tRNA ligase [Candidatus Paceibacterota bacterium]
MEQKIKNLITESLKSLNIEGADFVVEHPGDLSMGDYSTNVAMVLSKKLGQNPKDIAEKIVEEINKNKSSEIEKVEVAGPGFINFYLSPQYYHTALQNLLKAGENYGKVEIHKGKKILTEHTSINLFKPFHIGHLMNNAIGESITRFARFSGAEVTAISYPSDVSLGIGKAIFIILADGIDKLNSFDTLSEKLTYIGECYVRGTRKMEEDPSIEPRIREITKMIYDHISGPELDAYEIGKEINLSYFKTMSDKLGSKFAAYIFESEAGVEGKRLVTENVGKVFEESDGAIIYKGEQDGLHTRVFVNKEGYPTYEAKDVGLMFLKFSRYNPDISIFITDHEQSEYFKVVVHAAGKINKVWQDKTVHRTHGRMSFKGQKMSSRLGGVPIASTLLDAVKEEVTEKAKDIPEKTKEMISVAALKFAILKSMAGKNINFDPETSLSFEGDSGPYLQYSTVRAGSVLEKAGEIKAEFDLKSEITEVEKYLDRFEEVVTKCITLWEPHHMVDYLLNLSQRFNSWYGQVRIIDEENKEMQYNLAIVKAFTLVMKNGLYLLGIETPEKM